MLRIIQITADPDVTYYPNYCRPELLCIIQITVDSYLYTRISAKLLQTPSAMYYPNYCKALMLCII